MFITIIVIETLSVFIMLTRWSKRFAAGMYPDGADTPLAAGAFVGHILMGLIPLVGISYLYGQYLYNKELKSKNLENELASVQSDVKQLTG